MTGKHSNKNAAIHSTFTGALWGAIAGFATNSTLAAAFTAVAIGGYDYYQQTKANKQSSSGPDIDNGPQ